MPKELHAIRLQANRSRAGESADRPLARQSVSHHLGQLEAVGLVYRQGTEGGGERFSLNHQRLFALVDELRGLTRLRPQMLQAAPEGTIPAAPDGGLRLPEAPRLTVAYGWQDGLSFPLRGPVGTRWSIGRAHPCEVVLDHDPYVSSVNCAVERGESGFVLHDVPGNRNGTQLNWSPLPPGGSAPLRSGDVVGAGRTLLVAQL